MKFVSGVASGFGLAIAIAWLSDRLGWLDDAGRAEHQQGMSSPTTWPTTPPPPRRRKRP